MTVSEGGFFAFTVCLYVCLSVCLCLWLSLCFGVYVAVCMFVRLRGDLQTTCEQEVNKT